MKNKISMFLILAIFILAFFTSCTSPKDEQPMSSTQSYTDYIDTGKIISVQTGDIFGAVANDLLKASSIPEYTAVANMMEALRIGRTDALLIDSSYVKPLIDSNVFPEFEYLYIPEDIFVNQSGNVFNNTELKDTFNEWLERLKEDGTLDEMINRWLVGSLPKQEDIPKFDLTGENGILRVCDTGEYPPFTYFDEYNEPTGFDYELVSRFALYLGMDLEITMMDYASIIPTILSNKADMSACLFTITEERSQSTIFSAPVTSTQGVLVVPKIILKEDSTISDTDDFSFINWFKIGVERNLITDNRWKMIVHGLGITMLIAFTAQIFGTILGSFICWILMRKNKFVRGIGNMYCGLIRGTPAVVLLMITFYIIFGKSQISNVIVAITSFTFIIGASVAQILKGAIDTIDPVEIEAARSVGFSAFKAFIMVTLPQSVKIALPAYTNSFVELVKLTSIVGYIAIQDLTRAGDIIRSRTYDAYFPLLLVAVIYLIVTGIFVQAFKLIIRKINTKGGKIS